MEESKQIYQNVSQTSYQRVFCCLKYCVPCLIIVIGWVYCTRITYHNRTRPILLILSFLYIYQLVDEQRKYFKAVKDFQDECNKNDWLSNKLEQITRQQ